ncbi:hypothetical protein ASF70_08225 [Rhizobium sp. Leaf321]|nr:hypothetical protein [Rhizobium sp. Leaf321]KQQ73778.1 hypothetical protein ASF70_08225 [Rhizobium sp. Leaf321]
MDFRRDSMTASYGDPNSGFSVVFEDDGRVAYAYLLTPDAYIVADVWLYNRVGMSVEPEWHDRNLMPFANPSEFIRHDLSFDFPEAPSDISVTWNASEPLVPTAHVHINGELFGRLRPGSKPGWSLMAAKDGPLALILDQA